MKTFFTLILAVLLAEMAAACDICGSGAGNSYLGLLPDFRKRFIGLRYQHNSLRNHLGQNGNSSYLTATERYDIVDLWGAANLGNKFRVSFSLPYASMKRIDYNGITKRSGIGDATVTGYYNLFTAKKSTASDRLFVHSLWVGAGVKAPTGDYDGEEKNVVAGAQNTFQLGTGSVDFLLQALYDARLQDGGININVGYKMNTENEDGYLYGNKFTGNVLAYYKLKPSKSFGLVPNAGVLIEKAGKDMSHTGVLVFETGGNSLMGLVGLELAWNRIGGGLNFQKPLSQELGEGRVKAGNRFMTYISYSF